MINERYLEFLALKQIEKQIDGIYICGSEGQQIFSIKDGNMDYNYDKFKSRIKVLSEEILEPYVINSNSKE